ncbi:MAG: hypothetical protein HC875_19160 [Anaerolineales bacterium]|nr:hypothetical protein [Anaerolineales bacterium]
MKLRMIKMTMPIVAFSGTSVGLLKNVEWDLRLLGQFVVATPLKRNPNNFPLWVPLANVSVLAPEDEMAVPELLEGPLKGLEAKDGAKEPLKGLEGYRAAKKAEKALKELENNGDTK